MTDNAEEYLTVQQAADLLATTGPEVRRLLALGILTRHGASYHPRLRYAEVLTYRATVNRLRKEARLRATRAARILARAKAQARIEAARLAVSPQEQSAQQGLTRRANRQHSAHQLPDADLVAQLREIVT